MPSQDPPPAPPNPDLTHFLSIPWCSALLLEPGWTTVPAEFRKPKATTEDLFTGQILNTPDTVSALLAQYLSPASPPSYPPIPEVRTFISYGAGVSGWPHLSHGGFLATVLDEVAGSLLRVNARYLAARGMEAWRATAFTVNLNVNYRKGAPAPGTMVVSAGFREAGGGRKTVIWMRGVDEMGEVLVDGDSTFVEPKTGGREFGKL